MKSLTCLLAILALLAGCVTAQAQTKIAVINTREVLTKCIEGGEAVAQIQEEFAKRRQAVAGLEREVGELQKQAKEAGLKFTKKPQLEEKVRQLVQQSQQLNQDVTQRESVRFQPIVDKVNKILAAYAKEKGVTGIQDRNMYVYVDPATDITEEIIKRVNQEK